MIPPVPAKEQRERRFVMHALLFASGVLTGTLLMMAFAEGEMERHAKAMAVICLLTIVFVHALEYVHERHHRRRMREMDRLMDELRAMRESGLKTKSPGDS